MEAGNGRLTRPETKTGKKTGQQLAPLVKRRDEDTGKEQTEVVTDFVERSIRLKHFMS